VRETGQDNVEFGLLLPVERHQRIHTNASQKRQHTISHMNMDQLSVTTVTMDIGHLTPLETAGSIEPTSSSSLAAVAPIGFINDARTRILRKGDLVRIQKM
jgi:hypothetical protein